MAWMPAHHRPYGAEWAQFTTFLLVDILTCEG